MMTFCSHIALWKPVKPGASCWFSCWLGSAGWFLCVWCQCWRCWDSWWLSGYASLFTTYPWFVICPWCPSLVGWAQCGWGPKETCGGGAGLGVEGVEQSLALSDFCTQNYYPRWPQASLRTREENRRDECAHSCLCWEEEALGVSAPSVLRLHWPYIPRAALFAGEWLLEDSSLVLQSPVSQYHSPVGVCWT